MGHQGDAFLGILEAYFQALSEDAKGLDLLAGLEEVNHLILQVLRDGVEVGEWLLVSLAHGRALCPRVQATHLFV